MIAFAACIWLIGMPVAHLIAPDPTGTRCDHLLDAVTWPLAIALTAGIVAAGIGIAAYDGLCRLRRTTPC